MVSMRSSASVIEVGRDIMAACAPTTGTRATGVVLIRTRGTSGPVYLPRNWALIPVVNRSLREDLLFKVGEGPESAEYPNGKRVKASEDEPDAGSWWVIQPAGTLVTIHSLLGGKRHNLPKGTKFILDPENSSLEVECELQAAITDGADPTHFGGCMGIMQFEQLQGPTATLDAFRSELGALPGIVVVWSGSQPADGTTQSTLDRGASRAGVRMQLFKEMFDLYVISKRLDSGPMRRAEGLKLLDDVTKWLTDVQSVDGQIFSTPNGVQIRGRGRVATNNPEFQSLYIYLLQLSVTCLFTPYDVRTYSPWLRTHNEFQTVEVDGSGNRLVVVDQDIDMSSP